MNKAVDKMAGNGVSVVKLGGSTSSSAGSLTGILQSKTLKTDINGKVLLLDKTDDDEMEALQKESIHLRGTVQIMQSLDRSVRDNLIKLIEAWDNAIETLNKPAPICSTSALDGNRSVGFINVSTEPTEEKVDLSSDLELEDLSLDISHLNLQGDLINRETDGSCQDGKLNAGIPGRKTRISNQTAPDVFSENSSFERKDISDLNLQDDVNSLSLHGDSANGEIRASFQDGKPDTCIPRQKTRALSGVSSENRSFEQRETTTESCRMTDEAVSTTEPCRMTDEAVSSVQSPSKFRKRVLQDNLMKQETELHTRHLQKDVSFAVDEGSKRNNNKDPGLNRIMNVDRHSMSSPINIQQRAEVDAITLQTGLNSTINNHRLKRSFYQELRKEATTYRDLRRIISDFTKWQKSHFRPSKNMSKTYKRRAKFCTSAPKKSRVLNSQYTGPRPETKVTSKNEKLLNDKPLVKRKPLHSCQLIGEVSFQLERRVLAYIFRRERVRVEYSLSNIDRMIMKYHKPTENHLMNRKRRVLTILEGCGLNINRHLTLMVGLSEAYGTFDSLIEAQRHARENGWENHRILKYDVLQMTPTNLLHDVIVLIDCLIRLAKSDKKDIFLW